MMKYRYRFHPNDYALGENEKFYSDMEAAGWRLVNRGVYLSKFERCESSAARYRIEVSAAEFLGETNLSEEQVMVYADCGWVYVTGCGLIHVFRTPAGSDAPEFYSDPRQQAATLKSLRRQYINAWIPPAVFAILQLLLAVSLKGSLGETYRDLSADWRQAWVNLTAFYAGALVILLLEMYHLARGAWRITRTYRQMKKGIPLDHNPEKRHLLHKIITRSLLTTVACFALLAAWQMLTKESYDMPEQADGPYLTLDVLGWTGERTYAFYRDKTSKVIYTKSLMAEYWDCFETRETDTKGNEVWVYQDVYRLKDPEKALWLADTLMDHSTFANFSEEYTAVEIEGLDYAWTTWALEAVAVKDDLVAFITYSEPSRYQGEITMGAENHLVKFMTALAEKWENE